MVFVSADGYFEFSSLLPRQINVQYPPHRVWAGRAGKCGQELWEATGLMSLGFEGPMV